MSFDAISYAVREYTFGMKCNILDNIRFWWELFPERLQTHPAVNFFLSSFKFLQLLYMYWQWASV